MRLFLLLLLAGCAFAQTTVINGWGGSGSSGTANVPTYTPPSTAPPAVSSLTWVNQSTSTAVDSSTGIFMTQPIGATTFLAALTQPLSSPSSPYTFTVGVLPILYGVNSNLICIGVTDGTKFLTLRYGYDSTDWKFEVTRWTNFSTFSANDLVVTSPLTTSPVIWLQIKDDGTNLNFLFSWDGVNFVSLFSEARTGFLTATKVAVGLVNGQASFPLRATFSSWKVSYP